MIESKHGWGKDFDANCTNFRERGPGLDGVLAVRPTWDIEATLKAKG